MRLWNVLFILLTLWLVPETKHVSLEHIERNLMKVVNCAKSALTINLLRLPPVTEEATSLQSSFFALSSAAMKTSRLPYRHPTGRYASPAEKLAQANLIGGRNYLSQNSLTPSAEPPPERLAGKAMKFALNPVLLLENS